MSPSPDTSRRTERERHSSNYEVALFVASLTTVLAVRPSSPLIYVHIQRTIHCIRAHVSATCINAAGGVYVRLPNVCCSAFGYTGAPFSVACLLINPETLIASYARVRARVSSTEEDPRVFPSVYTSDMYDARDTRSRGIAPRVSTCFALYV